MAGLSRAQHEVDFAATALRGLERDSSRSQLLGDWGFAHGWRSDGAAARRTPPHR